MVADQPNSRKISADVETSFNFDLSPNNNFIMNIISHGKEAIYKLLCAERIYGDCISEPQKIRLILNKIIFFVRLCIAFKIL